MGHDMRRKWLSQSGISLSYLDSETPGPLVLLLHGLAGQASEWAATIDSLAGSYRVVALDQRGHGQSDKRLSEYSRESFVADAARLVESLGDGPAIVVGQSMGGVNAIVLAAVRPELVVALVVVEASVSPDPDIVSQIARWLDSWPTPFATRDQAVGFFGGNTLYARTWAEVLEETPSGYFPQFMREDMLASVADMAHTDRWEQWLSIRCPTLVVAGGAGLSSRDEMKRMSDAQSRARYVEVPGAGHDVHLEKPVEWQEILESYLAEAVSGRA